MVRTQKEEDPPIKPHEVAQRSLEVLLLMWAWLKCWMVICSAGYNVCTRPNADVRDVAPLAVLLVGLAATSILGCHHYRKQGRAVNACIAALNLDTPYLACAHGVSIACGRTNSDWEKLKIRHSIWRSLPLAMITFVLASRAVFEIPICQGAASASAMAVSTFPELAKKSEWADDLHRDLNVGVRDILQFQVGSAEKVPSDLKGEKGKQIAMLALQVEHSAWDALHCHDSKWQKMTLPFSQDCSQHWISGRPVSLEEDGTLGSIGSGSILAMNFVLWQEIRQQLLQQEASLKPALQTFLKEYKKESWVGFRGYWGSKLYSWESFLDKATEAFLQGREQQRVTAVQSGRVLNPNNHRTISISHILSA